MKTLREYIDQLDEISRRDFLKGAGAAAVAGAAGYKVGQDSSNNKNPYTVDSLTKEDLTAIDTFLTWYALVRKMGKPKQDGSRNFDDGLETGTVKDLVKVYGNKLTISSLTDY